VQLDTGPLDRIFYGLAAAAPAIILAAYALRVTIDRWFDGFTGRR
jgi:hypothetical protein